MKPFTTILLFSGLLVFSASCIAGQGMNNPDRNNLVDPQSIVNTHNSWRQQVGVGRLRWSPALANKAIGWANKLKNSNGCRMKHNGPGENLYMATAYVTTTRKGPGDWQRQSRVQEVSEQHVVDSWGSEKQWYSYESTSCNAPTGKSCGHYTQMVWEGTTEVGCGKAICSDNSQVWVCNYSPPGNIVGQSPY